MDNRHNLTTRTGLMEWNVSLNSATNFGVIGIKVLNVSTANETRWASRGNWAGRNIAVDRSRSRVRWNRDRGRSVGRLTSDHVTLLRSSLRDVHYPVLSFDRHENEG